MFASLGIRHNYGKMINGYAYGEPINGTYINNSANPKRLAAISGYSGSNSTIENVYSLIGVNTISKDMGAVNNNQVGNILGAIDRTIIKNAYSYAEGSNRDISLDANIGSASYVNAKNVYYVSEQMYSGKYSNKVSKLALRNKEFQEKILNNEKAFNIDDFVTYGYYPQLIWPDVMPKQEYIELPKVEDADLIDVVSIASVTEKEDKAEIVINVSNPSGERISDIAIKDITAKILNQETKNGQTLLTVEVSNPVKYLSKYYIRSITSIGAYNISYTREYKDKERTLEFDMYRKIRTVNDFKNIKNSLTENYKLVNDLDFINVTGLQLGNFSGKFDGGNHTIKNIEITSGGNLFGTVTGTIQNLKVENYKKTNATTEGGLIALVSTAGYVDNVHVKNIELTGVNYVGGIAARSSNGTISNSSVTNFKLGDLTNAKTIRIGGIVGNAANTMIDNCYAQDIDMKIFGVDITYGIGGIVGRFETGYIRNVYAEGTIEADTQEIGGIAGYHAGYIDSAISLVNIYTTQDSVGGIVGYATNSNITKTLVFGDVYSSKKTINLNRTTGNYASSPVANFAWEGQKVNGIESQLSNGDRLLTTEELNSELVYTSTIQLSDDFDYSKSALSILPKLYNYKTRELLPNQKDIKFVKQDFKIREINVSKSISTAIIQIHIDNPENYEITNIKIDGLKIDEVKKNITTDGYTLYEISASPEKYYDSYVLKEIEYLDAGKKKIKKESARVDVIFYKDLESFEDWQKISTTDSENYRLVADIDFEGKVNIKTDVMFNRLEGTGEGHTLKNMTVNLNKERSGLIASVISNIENVNFENIIVNNTATGDYTGLIRTLNSNASNLYFKNIKINTPKLSSSGIIGYNQGPDVRDIVIEDVEVIGKGYLGGFIGRCRYFDMTNISIKNVNIQGDGTYVGGMVGYKEYLYNPTHFNMSAENVTVVNKTGTYAGGVYGYGGATRTTAKNINVTGTSYVGGISGHSGTGTLTHNTITDSEIYGSTNAIGGITGYVYHAQYFYADNIKVYGTKETCTNVGGISGVGYTGGYAINYSGVANSLIESLGKNVGGIKGYLQTSNVNQSYVINTTVQGSQNVGGIVGTATGTTCVIYNCMTNATVIATDKSSGGIIGYVQNLNTTSANNITKIYYCIVQGANVGANYYSGGLIGSVDKILYPNHIYNNIVVTNVQSTLLNKNDYGAVIGNGDFYASGIQNLKVYEHSTVNNELIKNVDTGLDKSTLITLDQLKTQSTYTNINMTTSVFDYSQLKNNKYPKLKNATSSIFLDLPTSATTTNLLKRTRSSDIHVMPNVNVYAVDVDKINVEFSKIDPQTIFTINGESKAVNQLTYTYKYDFKEDFDIILTDGINKKTITIKKDEIVNKTSVSDGNYYYLDDSTVITNDTINSSNELAYHNNKIKQVTSNETINNAVNIFNDKILLDDQNIYNIKTKTIVQNSFENLTEIDVLPLYTFRFNDETIQTYYNYSIINNETITKQVFVKDSKIEVIDSSLNNKKDQIFIENYNGKTYILYLGTDNKLYNLKDDIKYPDKFKNRNIKSITSNITNNSNLIFVLYEDGNYILFDYHTGNIVLENKENKESIFSYFKESIKEISNKKIKKDNEYKKAKQLAQKITEKPIDEVLNKDISNEIIKNNNIVTSVYNPVTKKYILYEISDSNHGNSDSITNVFNNISISETIENNDTLYEYYNGTGEKQKKLILSATIIIGAILSLIIFATIFLFKNMKKNNSKI